MLVDIFWELGVCVFLQCLSNLGRRALVGQDSQPLFHVLQEKRHVHFSPSKSIHIYIYIYVNLVCLRECFGVFLVLQSFLLKSWQTSLTDLPNHLDIDEGTNRRRQRQDDDTFVMVKEYVASTDLRQPPLLVLTAEDAATYPLVTNRSSIEFLMLLQVSFVGGWKLLGVVFVDAWIWFV